ncbi:uncharacterized protein [Narcine bancroftii]|uniref:uncharacterized protein isoform X2 n=1 Tax=Narcine bancroftii TaxID=1343680 RepID=UPI003831BB19
MYSGRPVRERPQLQSLVLEYSCRHRLEPLTQHCLQGWDTSFTEHGTLPLRIACAALWSVVKWQHADHYGRVVDFVNDVWHQVSDLVSYRHYLKLCMAFKAKLVMEMFVKQRSLLDILQILDKYFPRQVPADPRVTRRDVEKERQCRLQFRKHVLFMIRDRNYREHFLKEEMEEVYGSVFMTAAQRLLWEFLQRLESALPLPRVDQLLASCVDRGSLSQEEKSLISLLADHSRSVSDILLQRMQQQWSQHRSGGWGTSTETGSGTPVSSTVQELEPRKGRFPGAEQVTLDSQKGELGTQGQSRVSPWMEEEDIYTSSNMGFGEEWMNCRTMRALHPHSKDWAERASRREYLEGRLHPCVFSALNFDLSEEEAGSYSSPTLSPPDPLQSQCDDSPAVACTLSQVSPAGRWQGSEGTCHPSLPAPQPPDLGPSNGIDIELLAGAPLSREVRDQLLRCSQFQPKVLLCRLTGQPEKWGLQEEAGLDSASLWHPSHSTPRLACRWNLRKRPRELQLGHASWDGSLFSSSEESSQLDNSDYEYFPFCSQLTSFGKWTTDARRNKMGQFIGLKTKDQKHMHRFAVPQFHPGCLKCFQTGIHHFREEQ